MHKNQIWLAFICTMALIVLWFTAATGYELFQYYSLNQKTDSKETVWSVVKKYSDRYILKADYTYYVKGHLFFGSKEFDQDTYRNHAAIEKSLLKKKEANWAVWYSSRAPEHSTIEKKYPIKSLIYAAILWAILLYFSWLGFYIGKFKSRDMVKG